MEEAVWTISHDEYMSCRRLDATTYRSRPCRYRYIRTTSISHLHAYTDPEPAHEMTPPQTKMYFVMMPVVREDVRCSKRGSC